MVSHNLYLAVALGGVIAAPGTILCVVVVKRCGRRISIAFANIFTAICFLLILTVPKGHFPQDWPRITLAGCGVVGMSVRELFSNEPITCNNLSVFLSLFRYLCLRYTSLLENFFLLY